MSFYKKTPFGLEFEYYWNGKLVGVALADWTTRTFSAIYTFYIAPKAKMSLGTFSLVRQIQYALKYGIPYFYLGYFILNNQSLSYKSGFRPNEVLIDQDWVPYTNVSGESLLPEKSLAWKNNEALVKTIKRKSFE